MSSSPELASVRRLVDRQDIIDLAWRYGACIDTRDIPGWLGLFTDDVEFVYQGGIETLNGRKALTSFFEEAMKWSATGPQTHVMSSVVVDFDDDDSAAGRVTGVAYLSSPEGKVFTRGLHYDDRYVRTPDGWRIARRAHNVDWEYQTPKNELRVIGQAWEDD